MAEFVSDVRKPRSFRADAPGPANCLFDGGVARMRFVTQGREHNVFEALQVRKTLFRYVAHVGEIGGMSKTKAADLLMAMKDRNPTKLYAKGAC